MSAVLIVIHLMIVLALIATVLLQRSEGGALGIGGGGGGNNNFMTGRSAANALTRTTTYLAIGFFATSVALSIVANYESTPNSILDQIEGSDALNGTGEGILDALPGALPTEPAAPVEPSAPIAE